jgi:hypothetical protein
MNSLVIWEKGFIYVMILKIIRYTEFCSILVFINRIVSGIVFINRIVSGIVFTPKMNQILEVSKNIVPKSN